MDDLIITTRHVFSLPRRGARPGYCRDGVKAWFSAHGLDWREFVRNGITAQRLEATGDAFALEVVKWARTATASEKEPVDG